MSKSKQYELEIAIGGKIDQSLKESINNIEGDLNQFKGTIKSIATFIGTAFVGLQIGDFLKDSMDSAKEFETSMASVAKVVDGLKDDNGKVTQSYYDMQDSIIEMSKVLPMTAGDMADIMASAGQANIAKEDLIAFTETATKMGIAFDSTAEQSGEWMAAWRTALKLNQDEVTTLADKINYLGNTSSEDAIKLSEVVTNIGSLGTIAGMAGEDVAAIAAAMTKVNSSVASTGIKNMIKALTIGESATKRQAAAYKSLGFNARDVSVSMQKDAQGTILKVLEGINKLDKPKQSSIITNLFGNESKQAIAPLISNLDNLKEQFNKVGDASLYAGSMELEYQAASSTSANLDILTANKKTAMLIELGNTLLPLSDKVAMLKGDLFETLEETFADNSTEISDFIYNAGQAFDEFLPTAIRKTKEFADSVNDFIEPIKPIGRWIEENPDLIAGTVVATGKAFVAYKIGKEIKSISEEVKKLGGPISALKGIITNPWAVAITAVATGFLLLSEYTKVSYERLKKADLANRFGEISLSLSDLDSVSSAIIKNENFSKIEEMLDIKDSFIGLENSIDDSIAALNKYNWKVGIGLELTEDEEASYKNSIISFISDTQELVSSNQYSITLAIKAIFGDSKTGTTLASTCDAFYLENEQVLKNLGLELNDAVNKAFSDGILTIDEAKEISNLQRQMSEITNKLTLSNFKASLEFEATKFSGSDLTSDSFLNMISSMSEHKDEAVAGYDDALNRILSSLNLQLEEKSITQQEYDSYKADALKEYNDKISSIETTITDYAFNTLSDTYGEEIDTFITSIYDITNQKFSSVDWNSFEEVPYYAESTINRLIEDTLNQVGRLDGISNEARGNLKELYAAIQPNIEELEKTYKEYEERGEEIPEAVRKGMLNATVLAAITGDVDSLYSLIGSALAEENGDLLKLLEEYGISIPEAISIGVNSNMSVVRKACEDTNSVVSSSFSKSKKIIDDFNISLGSYKLPLAKVPESWNKIPGYASGGIITKPTLATFAEEGPEAAIPLDGSKSAIDLWYTAGQILGIFDETVNSRQGKSTITQTYGNLKNDSSQVFNESSNIQISFSPEIKITGNADEGKVKEALSKAKEEFEVFIKGYFKEIERTSFR